MYYINKCCKKHFIHSFYSILVKTEMWNSIAKLSTTFAFPRLLMIMNLGLTILFKMFDILNSTFKVENSQKNWNGSQVLYSAVHAVRQHFASKNAEIKMKTMILRGKYCIKYYYICIRIPLKIFQWRKNPCIKWTQNKRKYESC